MLSVKKLNIADYFSIYRLVAAPILLLAIIFEQRVLTAALLLLSFLTDAIDGYLARKRKIETSRGTRLDTIGDLITLLIGLVAFIVFETSYFLDHLPIAIVATSLFIFQLVIALILFKTISSYHTYLAKATAVVIALFVVVTPVIGPIDILFYFTFYLAIAEALEEIVITFILHKPEENVKGLYWILKRSDFKFRKLKSV
jgi:phosphatidylglycerophosphate synthase